MEIEIASPNEKEKMMMKQYQAQIANVPPPEKGMVGQMGDMAKQRAMKGVLDAGQTGITSALSGSATPIVASGVEGGAMLGAGAGGAGAMTALGTAMPYVGAGLLAGKALGLFSHGGYVGPLSVMYQAEGTKPDYLDLDKDGNTEEPMAQAAKEKKPQYNAEGNTVPMPMMMMEVPMPMMRPEPVPMPVMKPNIIGMKYLQENPQDAAMSLEGYDAILTDPLMMENK